jgi:hypothetical protein
LEGLSVISGLAGQTAKGSFPPPALQAPTVIGFGEAAAAAQPVQADSRSGRVAALLASISQNNAYEGRDPAIIPDTLTSGFVADLLGLSISALADALVQLERLGLIAQAEGGALKLLDRPALERLIDSH